MPQDRSQQKQTTLLKLKKTSWHKNSAIMEIQLEYPQDTLLSEQEYNPLRDSMNQKSEKEFGTFCNKGNYQNYAQKYNP